MPVLEAELAGQEELLPLDLALGKPYQEYCLVLGLGIALLLLFSVISMFKRAANFTFIYYGS